MLLAEGVWTSYDILAPTKAGGFGAVVDAGPVGDFIKEGTVKFFLDGRFYVTQYKGALARCTRSAPIWAARCLSAKAPVDSNVHVMAPSTTS